MSPEEIDKLRENHAINLLKNGIFVSLSIEYGDNGEELCFKDLGFEFMDTNPIFKEYFKLGIKRYFPQYIIEEFEHIVKDADKNLDKYGIKIHFGTFIPFTLFDEWKSENDRIKDRFRSTVNNLIKKRDQIYKMARLDYEKLANFIWRFNNPNSKEEPQISFIDHFVLNNLNNFPLADEIVNMFRYEVKYNFLYVPYFIETDNSNYNKIFDCEDSISRTKSIFMSDYASRKGDYISTLMNKVVEDRNKMAKRLEGSLRLLKDPKSNKKTLKNYIERDIRVFLFNNIHLIFYNDPETKKALQDLYNEAEEYRLHKDEGKVIEKLENAIIVVKKDIFGYNS